MAKEQTAIRERERVKTKDPVRYHVIFHNDDFTTMEFVVRVLKTVFFKSEEEAMRLMMLVHRSEKAVVGTYTYDVAVSKTLKATRLAREEGFPLRIEYSPEN